MMTTNQLFFAIATLNLTLFALAMTFFKYYIDAKVDAIYKYVDAKFDHLDAKIDALSKNLDRLTDYMVDHAERISRLEERLPPKR